MGLVRPKFKIGSPVLYESMGVSRGVVIQRSRVEWLYGIFPIRVYFGVDVNNGDEVAERLKERDLVSLREEGAGEYFDTYILHNS
ncbi:MAG: hypothetical protein AABX66_03425 [Nanoarchaeota archaeon]